MEGEERDGKTWGVQGLWTQLPATHIFEHTPFLPSLLTRAQLAILFAFCPKQSVFSTSFWGRGTLEVCKGELDNNSPLNDEDEAGPISSKQPRQNQGALVFLPTTATEIPRASTLAVSAVS